MSKKVAIIQSCYIPWKGYFDIIDMVDEFILYDDMQYTKRDWRNRNLIKTAQGLHWLTIPVEVKGKYYQKINETKIHDKTWVKSHWQSLSTNYSKAKYFKKYTDNFEKIYFECENEAYLSNVNYVFIKAICSLLNINTKISWSTDFAVNDDLKKTERLVELCKQANATHYFSGPSAKNYIEADLFEKEDIKITYVDYSNYRPYTQLFGEFAHGVTILDLIFNVGPEAKIYMNSNAIKLD